MVEPSEIKTMNVQIVIATLQKKISDLTLTNVMLEAQISDLQSQLNSIKEQQSTENAINGNENQAQEIDNCSGNTDDF
jgi:TolA-binding protein